METQREEREDERLVSRGAGGDELFQSYCLLIAEFAAFIIHRAGLFYIIFQYQYPDSSIIDYLIYLTTELIETVYLREIGDDPIFTHRIHAFAGRSIFWIQRFTALLATAYFQSGKCRTLAALLFCFTNTVFIIKFVQWIYKPMNNETQPKQEPLLKAGIVEDNLQEEKVEPNQEPLTAEIVEEDRLPTEKVEVDLEPLEAEIVEEDKLPKEKVELDQELLEGEIVEEDKLPKEKVELQESLEGEIVVVVQEPSKTDLSEEEEALKFVMFDEGLLKLEYDNYLDPHDLEEHSWLAAVLGDRDELVKEPKEEPLKADLEDKSPSLKEANGERNEALLEFNAVYEDEDSDEDEDGDSTDDDDSDEDKDSDDDNDDEEGEDDKDEEEEEEEEKNEYEYPKLKATDWYKFSTEVEFENRLKKQLYKEQCLILEEEKKDLTAKLAAASESLELYLQNENDYLEDRNNWLTEKQNLYLKLDDAQTAYSQAKGDASKAKFYKAFLKYYENESCRLREERDDLSAKLSTETSYAEYYHKLFEEMEEDNNKLVKEMDQENRKLEEEKNDLAAKLSEAKALAELYRSYLHDWGF